MERLEKIVRSRLFYYALWLVGLCFLALPYFEIRQAPIVLLMLGRFHPVLLHFPIVLILLTLMIEVGRLYFSYQPGDKWILALLVVTVICIVSTVGSGYFLYTSGEYAGYLIDQHFWGGVITAFLTLVTLAFFIVFWKSRRQYGPYYVALIAANIAAIYTGHLGGSVTHGRDYLSGYLPLIFDASVSKLSRPDSILMVYDDYVAQIFESKCTSCHNDQRAKGGLSLGSYGQLFTKGQSGNYAVAPGMADYSELFKRVILPPNHDEHMPPQGKTPLTKDELDLLRHWINLGASDTLCVSQVADTTTLASIIKDLDPTIAQYRRSHLMAEISSQNLKAELETLAAKLQVVIRQDSLQGDNSYTLSMLFPPSTFGLDQLKELRPYFDYFTRVSLVSCDIDDAALYYLSRMKNLKELYLQKTKISGLSLIYLQKIPSLEILNLSFTEIDDKSAIDLLDFPALREVFLYRTNTSNQVIQALGKYKPELKIYSEEGPYF
ncbi:MAG: c-type cytochrome domain-containing protein [Saprospiraceae bacterium]